MLPVDINTVSHKKQAVAIFIISLANVLRLQYFLLLTLSNKL